MSQQNFDPAEERLQKLRQDLSIRPDDRALRARLLMALTEERRADEALELLATLRPLLDIDIHMVSRLMSLLTVSGRVKSALLLIDGNPPEALEDADFLMQAGNACMTAEEYERAATLFTQLVALEPSNSIVFRLRSAAYMMQGNNAQSLEDADACVSLAQENSEFRVHLGGMLATAQRYEESRNHLEKAVQLDPSNAHAQLLLSSVLSAIGMQQQAISAATEAVRLEPSLVTAQVHLANLLTSASHYDHAISILRLVLRQEPFNLIARRVLSGALAAAGNISAAIVEAVHLSQLAPDEPEYLIHAGGLLINAGRMAEALSTLTRACELSPSNAYAWRLLSGAELELGDLDNAEEHADRALKMEPGNVDYVIHREFVRSRRATDITQALSAALANIGVASHFTPGVRVPVRKRRPDYRSPMLEAFRTKRRVIMALVLRDIRSAYAGSRLGYIWALIEPMTHLLTLGIVFRLLNHSTPPLGDNLYLFYLTGVLPYFMFIHTASHMMDAIPSNHSLLQMPLVKGLDLIFAQSAISLWRELTVAMLSFTIFFLMLGTKALPTEPIICIEALLAVWFAGSGFGVLSSMVAQKYHVWWKIWPVITRVLYFCSGIFYIPQNFPVWVREYLSWNPILQGIEWFRSGFFRSYAPRWLDTDYILLFGLTCLFIGLTMERLEQRRMTYEL